MTTTIYGDEAAFVLTDTINATAVVPANGEPVDAVPPAATVKTLLDHIASTARQAYDETVYGVNKIRWFDSVASLKNLTGMQSGELVVLLDPQYTGGSGGLLNGFGLFVFQAAATWPQTAHFDGAGGGWVVITPDDNSGRWVNAAAGVGWYLGADPAFAPKPAQRTRQWSSVGTVNDDVDYTGLAFTNIGTEIVLGTGLPANATIHLNFDFSARSPTAGTSGFGAVIEVSVGGGAWTVVPGSKKPLGAGGGTGINTEWMSVHLGVAYVAPSSNTYDFRVSLSGAAAQTMTIFRTWSARGLSYLAT